MVVDNFSTGIQLVQPMRLKFNLRDRIKILFGKQVTVTTTIKLNSFSDIESVTIKQEVVKWQ